MVIFLILIKPSGTLAFLLYINNLYKSSNKLEFYLFAYDTSLTYANGDLKKHETEISKEHSDSYDFSVGLSVVR